jgi:tetratricopeptide (TPR) repeat protein
MPQRVIELDLPADPGEQHAMSAVAPMPKPDAEASPDDEGWALLDGLRRRLDDQVQQTRRTQDQVTQLAESIAALVTAQRRRSRCLNLNSFIAYLIFTMLLGGGFFLLYQSRANELVAARDAAVAERDEAKRHADDATGKLAAREQAEAKAWEVYQLIEQGKRAEATSRRAALRDLPLSRTERAYLDERAHQSQVMAIDAAFKTAVAAFKAGRFADAIAPLEDALKSEPASAPRAAQMHYYLGIAYAKGTATPSELDKAVAHLQTAVTADVDLEDARFQLASVLDRAGAYAKARTEYDRYATAHPQSPNALFAMRRSATLARMPPNAPPPGAPTPPAPANAPPPGAPTPPVPATAPTAPAPNLAPRPVPATPPVLAPRPNLAPPVPAPRPNITPPVPAPTAPPSPNPQLVAPPRAPAPQPPPAKPAPVKPAPVAPIPPPTAVDVKPPADELAVVDGPPTLPLPPAERRPRKLRPRPPEPPETPAPKEPEPPPPPVPDPPPMPAPPSPHDAL